MDHQRNLETLISKIDAMTVDSKISDISYRSLCKLAAEQYFETGDYSQGIYYLTETQGIQQRAQYCNQYRVRRLKKEFDAGQSQFSNIGEQCMSFNSLYTKGKYDGLLKRLKEMPEEWTLVQLSLSTNHIEPWHKRKPFNISSELTGLHIVRFSCGATAQPCYAFVSGQKNENDGTVNILRLIRDTMQGRYFHQHREPIEKIRKKRKEKSELLQSLTREVQSSWLKEWCCFLLGRLCNKELEQSIISKIDEAIAKNEEECISFDKATIYAIANGCAHLNDDQIDKAICQVIKNETLSQELYDIIVRFKNDTSGLISAKRHPVILLVQDRLESIPWELTPLLKRHPVSRLPSIHAAHMLFKVHQKSIIRGNKIISDVSSGFYLINPDSNLENTDKRLTQFLNVRCPQWNGIVRRRPSKDEFLEALTSHRLFLYCGHGNGTQYLNSVFIEKLNLDTLPLLFGCASVEYKDLGGRASFISLVTSYLVANCPSMLGMLWNVTNSDTDYMALTLLNYWLPGEPVDIREIEGFNHNAYEACEKNFKEPELLRAMKKSRDSAIAFTNSAALVVYGIPIKIDNP